MSEVAIPRSSRWRRVRYLAVPMLAVAAAIGLDWSLGPATPGNASAAEWGAAGYGPASFTEAMTRADAQLYAGRERLRMGPTEWLRQEGLAHALIARSRLSANYDDLAEAARVIAGAQEAAPANAGPSLTAAVVAMMTHRLDRSEAALATFDRSVAVPDAAERAEAAALRGDIAFYRGDLAAADKWYDRAERTEPGAGIVYRRANLAKATGRFDDAIRAFQSAGSTPRKSAPFQHASTAFQIGAVEQARGNYAVAADWFAAADHQFPGFWLFEAHRAQSLALAGDLPGGIAAMRKVAQKAPSAEVLDALAMLLRADGQVAESRQWAGRAGASWARRLKQAPEAAYAHALEHELVFGSPARAMDLARANLAARPFGESRVLLASALMMEGQLTGALHQLQLAEDSGWRSAQLYALRAQALELAGRAAEAPAARKAALALNPRIFDSATALVWLSHG